MSGNKIANDMETAIWASYDAIRKDITKPNMPDHMALVAIRAFINSLVRSGHTTVPISTVLLVGASTKHLVEVGFIAPADGG